MIETTCPSCGAITCEVTRFELWLCAQGAASSYGFTCPRCAKRVSRHAGDDAIQILISKGVRPRAFELPAEMLEAHDGPPITIDDVLDLHLALEQDDWFGRLLDAA
jgi:hypothetical protein